MFSNRSGQGKRIGRLLQPGAARPKSSENQTRRRVRIRLNDIQVDELLVAYRSGRTTYQLATQFGIHRTTVSNLLLREAVAIRNASLTQDQTQDAVSLYRSGLSLAGVGNRLGCDPGTVRLALIAVHEPRRDTHGREIG